MNKSKMTKHFVFYKTNIKYDGRVFALINTLSLASPNDRLFLLNYNFQVNESIKWPGNIREIKNIFTISFFRRWGITKYLNAIFYHLHVLWLLIKHRPATIQLHHEVVLLAPFLYKMFFDKVMLIYDDKELYHVNDSNIPFILFQIEKWTFKKSSLVIVPNHHRANALVRLNKGLRDKLLIVDNYEFHNRFFVPTDRQIVSQVKKIKQSGKRILLHQGFIGEDRGVAILKQVVKFLANDWCLCFIGLSRQEFEVFSEQSGEYQAPKLNYIGFIDYNQLSNFYTLIDAAIVFYKVDTFNSKFCAPNRLYSAANNGKPIIVNHDNVTLGTFIETYGTGVALKKESDINVFFDNFLSFKTKAEQLKGQFQHDEVIPDLYNFYLS